MWGLDKKVKGSKNRRLLLGGLATLLQNGNLAGFFSGRIYKGPLKNACLPGLNCYSCPGALGSCPIGALQSVSTSPDFSLSLLVLGFLFVVGGLLGRLVCGFLCPFGWVQELLHRIPSKKRSTKPLKKLTYVKYGILVVFVLLLPLVPINSLGMGDPAFCKYICPQGVLEGAIPLSIVNPSIREGLGGLFLWKFSLLVAVLWLAVVYFRPFCKWICPLGAIYALFNRFSLYRLTLVEEKCTHCGRCAAICPMDCDPTKDANAPECIRCGDCVAACPTGAIQKPFGCKGCKPAAPPENLPQTRP